MRLLSALLAGLVGAILATGCAGSRLAPGAERRVSEAARPGWAESPPAGEFVGISKPHRMEAEARSDALLDARKAIVEALGLRLNTEQVERILTTGEVGEGLETEVRGRAEARAVANNLIRTAAEEWHVERWERGTAAGVETYHIVFCRVPFREDEHRVFLGQLARETTDLVRPLAASAAAALGRDDLQAAVLHHHRVSTEADHVLSITGLDPATARDLAALRLDAVTGLERIAAGFRLEASPAEQTARRGRPAPEPLAVRVLHESNDTVRPVPGALVGFSFVRGDGDVTGKVWSDGEGWARGRVAAVTSSGDEAEVEARLHVIDGELAVAEALPTARFFIRTRGIRVQLETHVWLLEEESDENWVRARMVEALEANGFEVVSSRKGGKPDVRLMLEVRSGPVSPAFGDVLMSRGTALVEATDLATGVSIGAFSLPDGRVRDTKGFGVTAEDAARKAITLERVREVYGIDPFAYLAEAVVRMQE